MLEDISPHIYEAVLSREWIAKAIVKSRATYESLDKLLPAPHVIDAIMAEAPNAIEGMIRFEYALQNIQFEVHESESNKDRINAVLSEVLGLASKVGKKLASLPQAAADVISGVHRGGFDTYTTSKVGKLDPNDPLSMVFNDEHIAREES